MSILRQTDQNYERIQALLDHVTALPNFGQIVLGSDFTVPPIDAQVLSVPRIHVNLSGVFRVRTGELADDRLFDLKVNDAIYTPAHGWTVRDWRTPSDFFGVVFHEGFTRFLFISTDGELTRREPSVTQNCWWHTNRPLGVDGRALLRALTAMGNEGHRSASTVAHCYRALFPLLQDELAADIRSKPSEGQRLWQQVMAYTDEHAHEPIDRGYVARACGVHPNSVSRLFQRFGPDTFQGTLTRKRLEHASRLLTDRELTLEDVATRSGFANSNYFIKVFRRRYGLTPGEYRKRSLGRDGSRTVPNF